MVQGLIKWKNRARILGLPYRTIIILVVMSLVATVTEIFGIGIFLPIFQFIRFEGDISALVSESSLWQYVINIFSYLGVEPSLLILLLLSFIFFLSRQFFTYIRVIYATTVGQRLIQIQRNLMFNKYIKADTAYHDSVPVGNLVNVITTEVSSAVGGIMTPMVLMANVIMLIGYLSMLFILSWQMTLFSSIILLLTSRVPNVWIKKSYQIGCKLVNANTVMSEFLVGRLRSPRLVRLSGTENAEKKEFYQLTLAQRKRSVSSSILQAKTEVVMEPIVIGLSLIFLYFSYSVMQLQIEVIGLYLVIALRLLPVVKGILKQMQTVQKHMGSIEAVEGRLKGMTESIEKDDGVKDLIELKQSIVIDNVSYCYPLSKEDALKKITIEFNANQMIAIVGPSGGGKSTLIDLLPRLRTPREGTIRFDGNNIEKIRLKSLRQIIAYVPQSPQIFDGTIKNHVLYGKKNATIKEVQEALLMSGAEEFVNKLPQGIETIIGEDAIKLSGGQRQRLDLARALVRKSAVLILDEPTSNLDAESENSFKSTLQRIRNEENIIIIIVAHRLASIADADQIVVLNQGAVEDIGKHNDLLKKGGWYAKAWKMQSSITN
jgi:ABC-type multidrug transport system fused ATPase/permease subunit